VAGLTTESQYANGPTGQRNRISNAQMTRKEAAPAKKTTGSSPLYAS